MILAGIHHLFSYLMTWCLVERLMDMEVIVLALALMVGAMLHRWTRNHGTPR